MTDDKPALTPEQQSMQRDWADLAAWAEDPCPKCGGSAVPRTVAGGRSIIEFNHRPDCALLD